MLDFDVSNLEQINRRINDVLGKNSIFHLEWLAVYLEIKESLLGGDLDALFETKRDALATQVEILKAHQREGVPEMSQITKEFAQRKFVDIYCFLHTFYKQNSLFAMRGDRGDLYEPATDKENQVLNQKISEREQIAVNLLKEVFELTNSREKDICDFIERDFFKEDVDPQAINGILQDVDAGLKHRAQEFFHEEQNCYPAMRALLKDAFGRNKPVETQNAPESN